MLVYFSLPNELMTFLLVPILLVGVVHPRQVHWGMALVLFFGALWVIYRRDHEQEHWPDHLAGWRSRFS
jgi:hypothetical protein